MTTSPRTLLDIFEDIARAKFFILTGLVLGAIAATVFVNMAVPHYKAQMIISPANPMNGADVSSLVADDSLFALGYLVQRMGVNNSADFVRFENTYAGPSVAALLLKDEKIREGITADKTFSFSKTETNWKATTLADYIDKRVRMEPIGASPLRRLGYMHPDRDFAMYFLQNLHRVTDEMIRQKIRQDATQRVQYLQNTIAATTNPEHKRNLTALLMEQERILMLVSIETAYAASVIEPPSSTVKSAWPDALMIFPVSIFAGMILGFGLYELRMMMAQSAARRQHRPKSASVKKWFKTDSGNKNEKVEKTLSSRKTAAE